MLIIPDEVVTGAVVNAITVAGRRISAALAKPRGRRAEELDIAQWFETFRLTESVPDLPDLAPALEIGSSRSLAAMRSRRRCRNCLPPG